MQGMTCSSLHTARKHFTAFSVILTTRSKPGVSACSRIAHSIGRAERWFQQLWCFSRSVRRPQSNGERYC